MAFIGTAKGFCSAFKPVLGFAPKLEIHANEEAIRKEAERRMRNEAYERKRIADEKLRKENERKHKALLKKIEDERIRRAEEKAKDSRERYEALKRN